MENPWRPSRSRGAKAAGRRYERAVARILATLFPTELSLNPWFQYTDLRGTARCSPDALLLFPTHTTIIETKLTRTLDAEHQLRDLYAPVVRAAFGAPTTLVCVFRNWRGENAGSFVHFSNLRSLPPGNEIHFLHHR